MFFEVEFKFKIPLIEFLKFLIKMLIFLKLQTEHNKNQNLLFKVIYSLNIYFYKTR